MQIIGVDPAARKLAIWSGVDFLFKTLPAQNEEACGAAFRIFSDFLTEHPEPAVLYMEKPIQGRNTAGSLVQAESQGALMAAAAEFGVEVFRVDNMTWKKSLLGNGHAEKDQIAAYVKKRAEHLYDACKGNQDLMDALCVYWYGKKNYPLIAKARQIHAQAKDKKNKRRASPK